MIHTVTQGTPEWFQLRKGKMTASHAQEIGNCGKGLETYCYTIIAEKFSSNVETYSNEHTERGKELEGQARSLYELETGSTVQEIGFFELNEYVGASPDGIVGEGLIEIKCHNDVKHTRLICGGEQEIESSYIWQMQMQMKLLGAEWCDYVAYNPNFSKSLLIFRIYPDQDKFSRLDEGFMKGTTLLQQIENQFLTNQ